MKLVKGIMDGLSFMLDIDNRLYEDKVSRGWKIYSYLNKLVHVLFSDILCSTHLVDII